LAKVDCTVETELARRFSITGYPTMRIFNQRLEYHYQGSRQHEGIVDYMLNHVSLHAEGTSKPKNLLSSKAIIHEHQHQHKHRHD
jgi:hypothetical protein